MNTDTDTLEVKLNDVTKKAETHFEKHANKYAFGLYMLGCTSSFLLGWKFRGRFTDSFHIRVVPLTMTDQEKLIELLGEPSNVA